jgi:DHA2 family multidrug resistance protein
VTAETARAAAPNRGLITASVMLATIMQVLDTTIANVALPHMQGSLSASQDQISWVLTSYIVSSAIMTPTTGYLAGRFGRKRLFLIAVVGFTIASVLCGLAASLSQMVAYRLLQGMFGAALSAGQARSGDGALGRGRHARADPRADLGRLSHRGL